MKKKILIGVGLYLTAGVVVAAVLPSAKGLNIMSKLNAAALWPGWIFVYMTGRAGSSNAGLSPVGHTVAGIDNGRALVPEHLRNVVKDRA